MANNDPFSDAPSRVSAVDPFADAPSRIAPTQSGALAMPETATTSALSPENATNAFKSGLSTTARAVARIADRFYPDSVKGSTPAEDYLYNIPVLNKILPAKGYEPKSLSEKGVQLVGSVADPGLLAAGSVIGPAAEATTQFLGTAKTLASAEADFAANSTRALADQVFKARLANSTVKGAAEGLGYGGYNAATNLAAKREVSLSDIGQAGLEVAAGGLGGAALGAGGTLFKGKPNALYEGRISVQHTPASRELESQLGDAITQQAKLSQELSLLTPESRPLPGLIDYKVDSQLSDVAAQKVAFLEKEHAKRISNIVDPEQLAALSREHQGKLDTVAGELGEDLKYLQEQREKILPSLLDNSKIEATQAKLQANLERQALLQDQMQGFGFKGYETLKNKAIPQALDIAHSQAAKVDGLVSKGLVSDEVASKLRTLEFQNALQAQGIDLNASKANQGFLANVTYPLRYFINRAEDLAMSDKRLGSRQGEVALEANFASNRARNAASQYKAEFAEIQKGLLAKGYNPHEITNTLQYVESGPNGVYFDPNPVVSQSLTRPAYAGPMRTLEPEFVAARQLLDKMQDATGVSKARGYIPLREMPMENQGVIGGKAENITDPLFGKARTSGLLIPGLHETDFGKLMSRYSNEVARHVELDPIVQRGVGELSKLRLMGENEQASRFQKYLTKALGLNDIKDATQIFGDKVFSANREVLDKVAQTMPNPEAWGQQVWNELKKSAHLAVVSGSATPLLKHSMSLSVLPSEVGVKYAARGAKDALAGPFADSAKRLINSVRQESLPALEEFGQSKAGGLVLKALRFQNGIMEKTAGALYNKADKGERLVTLAAASHRAFDAVEDRGLVGLMDISKHMSPSEQNLIQRAFNERGSQAGQDMYALLTARRVNGLYTAIDKPQVLDNMIGDNILFTGYLRNVVSRYVSDLSNSNSKQLIGKMVGPMVGFHALSYAIGDDPKNPSGSPLEQLDHAAKLSIAPQVLQPLAAFKKRGLTGAADEALRYTLPGAANRIYNKATGSQGGIVKKIME